MSNGNFVVPRLDAVKVHGMTRSAFILRGALATGAAYGAGTVGPFVRAALAQEEGTDVGSINFALTLENLEAAFYGRALAELNLGGQSRQLAQDIESNEREHVETLTQTVEQLGGRPEAAPQFEFPLDDENGFLDLAVTFEDTGVAAYNGIAPSIRNRDLLAAVGAIVQVEARHAAAIRLQAGQDPAPRAFDQQMSRPQVERAIRPYIRS